MVARGVTEKIRGGSGSYTKGYGNVNESCFICDGFLHIELFGRFSFESALDYFIIRPHRDTVG